MEQQNTYPERVTRGDDGKYRWIYEVNLLKSPSVFFLVWKIFFLIFLAVFVVASITDYMKWGAEKVLGNLPFFGYFFIGMTAVVGLGYLIYAAIMGGKYIVEFEMDEKGFLHRQTARQAKKARAISRAAVIAGAASGSAGAIGAGISAQRTEMYTAFSKVKRIKAYPKRHVIKVKETLEHNQLFVSEDDFAFVLDFVFLHCPQIKP